jgi:hypothetical protein
VRLGGSRLETRLGNSLGEFISKITRVKWTRGAAQEEEHLEFKLQSHQKQNNNKNKTEYNCQTQCLMFIIPSTWEVKIRRMVVSGEPGQKVSDASYGRS